MAALRQLPLYILIWFALEGLYSEYNIRQGETCTFDWDAYMEQCSKLAPAAPFDGALTSPRFNFNYTELRGDTGPLVYPALHTWIHLTLLKSFSWDASRWTTESVPKDIPGYEQRTHRPHEVIARIQRLYLALHLATVALAAAILISTGLIRIELHLLGQRGDRTCVSSSSKRTSSLSALGQLFTLHALKQLVPTVVACVLLSLSSRVRNVSTTGLFNDTWSMLLAHAAVLLFVRRRWNLGCLLYSASVAVKMNTLLMAPGLLYLLLAEGGIPFALPRLAICGLFQVVVALPFLLADPRAYLMRAFDLGRAFEQQWSVNWSFLPAEVFSSKAFAAGQLALQLLLLLAFVRWVWRPAASSSTSHPPQLPNAATAAAFCDEPEVEASTGIATRVLRDRRRAHPTEALQAHAGGADQSHSSSRRVEGEGNGAASVSLTTFLLRGLPSHSRPSAALIAFILYSSNMVGVACARSLHFQFFCWYYHSLPLLLQYAGLPWLLQIIFVVLLEVCWGNHPPQPWSSMGVTALHFLLVAALLVPRLAASEGRGRSNGAPLPLPRSGIAASARKRSSDRLTLSLSSLPCGSRGSGHSSRLGTSMSIADLLLLSPRDGLAGAADASADVVRD